MYYKLCNKVSYLMTYDVCSIPRESVLITAEMRLLMSEPCTAITSSTISL